MNQEHPNQNGPKGTVPFLPSRDHATAGEVEAKIGTPARRDGNTVPNDDAIEALVADATDQFMDRAIKGEDPNIEEHARRYPQISGILRELLPAVRLMQQKEPAAGEPLGLLGDFRLVRQIGRGGMGVVYEAEQISLRRRVALKVLPLAAALDPRQLERFRLEAQAAAHLHHSNIVPIYSVGCERGVYYYAMQFIEGRSLAEVIAHGVAGQGVVARQAPANDDPAAGAAAGSSSRGNDPISANETKSDALARTQTSEILQGEKHFQRIAALGIQAADALEHAHSMGVIHRDIKPANLLLDTRGTLYVADFGLARLQGDVGLTQSGGLAGTLRYMSPEQVLGQRGIVDHRTDLYSLGVTLYELLALAPAFDATDRPALLQQIVYDEPLPLRQRNKHIPVDLETIILKAMAKEPAARYANGQQMAEDLRRFLDHRPILARRPTLWESTAKWTRRHRAVAVAALVVVVLCAIGFAISTALVMRAYNDLAQEQKKTQAAYLAESQQRSKAERSMQQAREVVDFMTQVSEEELGDKPELTGVRRMLLASALDYYQEFIKHSQDDPSLRAQLVASHVRVAAILDEIGSKPEALAALQQARTLQEKLLHSDPMMPELQRGFFSIYSRLDLLRGGRDLNLLQQRSVQDDLGLSKAQVAEVDSLMHQRRDRLADTRRLTAEQWRLKFEQLDEQQRRVAELLQPKQIARLAQIALQQRGSEAFTDPEIAAALTLSQQQIQQIRTLREESRQNVWSMVRPGEMRVEQWRKARDLARKTNDSILAVLTPEQTQKWNDLTGAKFEGKLMSHRGGWRGWPRERAGGQRDLPLPLPLDETKVDEP